ncbi:hypothetical protein LXL04_025142 [Taraxacum kok-saghyz]
MRKHGWQLPYHPLQVVAVSVFLALGFAFYVFFAPFVGKKLYQYIVMGIYTPLILCSFGLYIWCAGADPADTGVFKSRKYSKPTNNKTGFKKEGSSSIEDRKNYKSETEKDTSSPSCFMALVPCAAMCHHCSSQDQDSISEDGMFYCNLCEVEVYKYSKHCRVCDKCVDRFDHHCRWLNNCIGKKNYLRFFALMVSALLMLILQWSTGIVVLINCILDHKRFNVEIASKLGSSFTLAPYVTVVVVCTILAMIATLPLVQLFFFHILLIKKGISTYDYIIALREQENQGPQSPQMSPATSITGLSSVSSFNTFRQGAWCTPPRLFVEDQYDVVPPETSSVSSFGKKTIDDPIKKKNPATVKISPWTLARLNADDVSKAAAEARKKSKILQPVSKRGRGVIEKENPRNIDGNLGNLVPLQHEARSVFRGMPISMSSPDSSMTMESPDIQRFMGGDHVGVSGVVQKQGIEELMRSMSDGYDASGGEDSDRVPSKFERKI